MSGKLPLLLFAKAPIAGKVKTRLTSHCSAKQAADIAKLLMETAIQRTCKHWPGQVYLSTWLDSDHTFFVEMQQRYPILMNQQCEGDLGEKMHHALSELGFPAAVMGCDAPHVQPKALEFAYQSLLKGESVIGPSEDGGYYLLGLCRKAEALFVDKNWGTERVLKQTLASAASIELPLSKLPELNDVDEWSDLIDAAGEIPSLQQYLQTQSLYDTL